MAVLQVQAFQRDGLNRTFLAFQDMGQRVPSILTGATFRGRARHQITGQVQSLTVALASASPGDANRLRVSASLTGWTPGIWIAEVAVNQGSGWRTADRFEILIHEDIL
jgi:hypothetical protein